MAKPQQNSESAVLPFDGGDYRMVGAALVINPYATKLDVLRWAHSELLSLCDTADLLASGMSMLSVEPSHVAEIFRQRMRPAVDGLGHLLDVEEASDP